MARKKVEGYLYHYVDTECDYYIVLPCKPKPETLRKVLLEALENERIRRTLKVYAKLHGLKSGNIDDIVEAIVKNVEKGNIHFLYDDIFFKALEVDCKSSMNFHDMLNVLFRQYTGKHVIINVEEVSE